LMLRNKIYEDAKQVQEARTVVCDETVFT
jgi:hypothetical protein